MKTTTEDNREKYSLPLTDEERLALQEELFHRCMDGMFGDGLEADYIRDGFSWPGINNLSDQDLFNELGEMCDGDLDEDCNTIALYFEL